MCPLTCGRNPLLCHRCGGKDHWEVRASNRGSHLESPQVSALPVPWHTGSFRVRKYATAPGGVTVVFAPNHAMLQVSYVSNRYRRTSSECGAFCDANVIRDFSGGGLSLWKFKVFFCQRPLYIVFQTKQWRRTKRRHLMVAKILLDNNTRGSTGFRETRMHKSPCAVSTHTLKLP